MNPTSLAPYMQWAKQHPHTGWDLTGSNLLACGVEDLPGARDTLELHGDDDEGYPPLLEGIAARYGVSPAMVATAQGTSGANFLVYFALVRPGDQVLVERPGYDPLYGPIERLGGQVTRFDRRVEDGWRLDPDAVQRALTPRTRLIVITNTHNPTGALAGDEELDAVGRLAERVGAWVLVDEVYLDSVPGGPRRAAAARSPIFITTSSLTKSYGLPGLRCGWVLGAPDVAERIRRARDVVDGTGAFPAERLSVLAFRHLDALSSRAQSILRPNHAAFARFLDTHPRVECLLPCGGTTVFPRLRDADDAETLVNQLARDFDTGVVPGRFFQASAHFRIGLGGPAEVLEEGLRRIGSAINE